MTYQLLKWVVVNTSDADPFKHTDPSETYWTFDEAQQQASVLSVRHSDAAFIPVQMLVPYEVTPIPGFGNGPGSGPTAPHPYNPLAMEALMDKFAKFLERSPSDIFATKTTTLPYTINNQEENPTNGKV